MTLRRTGLHLAGLALILSAAGAWAGPASGAVKAAAETIVAKFGRGAAGQTVEEVAEAAARAVARHGDEALPFLRQSGHAGFTALHEAGERAPDLLRLFARKGDEAIWIATDPGKLALFLRHGDEAADALLRHPGLADDLLRRVGGDAAAPLNRLTRPAAQRLGMAAEEGLLTAAPRSGELLGVLARHGDAAMEFIWRHRKALAVSSVLATFLNDPEAYFTGAKELAAMAFRGPLGWGLAAILALLALPLALRAFLRSR